MSTIGETPSQVLTYRLPSPHPGQRVVLASPRRFRWVAAGRRWRKTSLGVIAAVEAALQGKKILWGAPTYDQARIGWDELYRSAGGSATFNLTRMDVTFKTGGRVTFRSLDDPDNARGHTADGIVLDEAALIVPVAWTEVVRPIISDTGGWALFLSTPHGRNWFWREWVGAREDPQSAAWSVPTLGVAVEDGRLVRRPHPMENTAFPFDEALNLYQHSTEKAFRQEFLAEFLEETGGVFRRVREAAIAGRQEKLIPGHQYVIGVDWGRHDDFTVFAVVDLDAAACVYLDRMRETEYLTQANRLHVLYERFRPRRIIAEKNAAGEPLVEHLHRLGLPVQAFLTTAESKRTAIESLALAFERSAIRMIRDDVLMGELEAYQAERLPSGLLRYSAPDGMHDDCVMALAMAWTAMVETPRTSMPPVAQPSWRTR